VLFFFFFGDRGGVAAVRGSTSRSLDRPEQNIAETTPGSYEKGGKQRQQHGLDMPDYDRDRYSMSKTTITSEDGVKPVWASQAPFT